MYDRKAHILFAYICTQMMTEVDFSVLLWWWATTFCWKRQMGHGIKKVGNHWAIVFSTSWNWGCCGCTTWTQCIIQAVVRKEVHNCNILYSCGSWANSRETTRLVRLPDVLERQGLSLNLLSKRFCPFLKNILLSLNIFLRPWKFLNI